MGEMSRCLGPEPWKWYNQACSFWGSLQFMICQYVLYVMLVRCSRDKLNRVLFRINKFFEVDFAIKVNASNERRFDHSVVIFKFGVRIKLHV